MGAESKHDINDRERGAIFTFFPVAKHGMLKQGGQEMVSAFKGYDGYFLIRGE